VLDRQALLRACRLLPTAQRTVLVLRFWEDRSIEETAAVLGCTPGTVKSHTHRALQRLRAVLDDAPGPAMSPAGPALAPAGRIDDVDGP
jgi:DNA-directed RNA polymerase specialized sigma24 family protein